MEKENQIGESAGKGAEEGGDHPSQPYSFLSLLRRAPRCRATSPGRTEADNRLSIKRWGTASFSFINKERPSIGWDAPFRMSLQLKKLKSIGATQLGKHDFDEFQLRNRSVVYQSEERNWRYTREMLEGDLSGFGAATGRRSALLSRVLPLEPDCRLRLGLEALVILSVLFEVCHHPYHFVFEGLLGLGSQSDGLTEDPAPVSRGPAGSPPGVEEDEDGSQWFWWRWRLELCADLAFLVGGIVAPLVTISVDPGLDKEVVRLATIRKVVLRRPSWWLELVSFLGAFSNPLLLGNSRSVAGTASVGLFHLLRGSRLLERQQAEGDRLGMQLAWLLGTVLVLVHLAGCGWALVRFPRALPEVFQDQILHEARAASAWEAYIHHVYEMSGLLVAGSPPQKSVEESSEVLALSVTVPLSAFFMAYILARLIRCVELGSLLRGRQAEHLALVKSAVQEMRLPESTAQRILRYYRFRNAHDDQRAKEALFCDLSNNMLLEVKLLLFGTFIRHSPFFSEMDAETLASILMVVSDFVCSPGDYVIREGEQGEECFFVLKGSLDVLPPKTQPSETGETNDDNDDYDESSDGPLPVATLGVGSIVGEVALLVPGRRRSCSICARSYALLSRLDADNFGQIMEKDPEPFRALLQTGRYRNILWCGFQPKSKAP